MPIKLNKPESVLLTSKEAANLLGVSDRYLAMDRHIARSGGTAPKVPYVSLGHRTIRYKRSDLLALIEANRVE
ncbi:MAG: helix-turn-helix domain-containing protein [Roseovarius pacificus]|nr:helix-turn-helix domain-containing protein [Roseovarius pacificus]